ncbi:MAG: hypothetical protein JW767_11945 [Thermoleophilia bacterium]|nr:hypothetical protein [Thermoleophilia bacterium]
MTKVRRGGYVFLTWKGDHPPRHVQVLRAGRLVLKWNLEHGRPMQGVATGKLLALIRQLEDEGRL